MTALQRIQLFWLPCLVIILSVVSPDDAQSGKQTFYPVKSRHTYKNQKDEHYQLYWQILLSCTFLHDITQFVYTRSNGDFSIVQMFLKPHSIFIIL